MRQLCLSKDLIPSSFLEDLRRPPDGAATGPSVQISTVPNEKRQQLVERLQRWMADKEGCAVSVFLLHRQRLIVAQICLEDTLSDPRITDCGHACECFYSRTFCRAELVDCNLCISHYISVAESPNCPYDRHPISLASLLELPPEASEFVELDENATSIKSAKISELVKYLKVFDPTDKTLVFSQFTSFLDHVAAALREEGIAFCRFDGSMNAKQVRSCWGVCLMRIANRSDLGVPSSGEREEPGDIPSSHAHLAEIGSGRIEPDCSVECVLV